MSNRITGVALSGGMYLFGLAYLVAPTLGWHLESASIAAAVASWPILVKIMLKTTCAFPLTYHTFKGIQASGVGYGRGVYESAGDCRRVGCCGVGFCERAGVGFLLGSMVVEGRSEEEVYA